MSAGTQLQDLLGLRTPPVGLTFRPTPPPGVPRADHPGPSGCTYWQRAAEGHTFYTEEADHYNCPIGAYTHGIDLPPERASELEQVVGTMIDLSYLRPEEVPGIPRRTGGFGVAVYAPLTDSAEIPDVVLVRGNARQMMLLSEGALAAGAGPHAGLMGRPTCAAVPEVSRSQTSVVSLGCIGNRVYTGMADDELYFVLPGKAVGAVTEKLAAIVKANRALEDYHRARLATNGTRGDEGRGA
jgi:uncharacterized protein (DUF169 family)